MREDVKRWTLRDVGEILDKAMAKELAEQNLSYDPLLDDPIYNKDIKPEKFRWNTWFFDDFSKIESGYLEDLTSQFDNYPTWIKYKKYLLLEASKSIDYEDRHWDHSINSINDDEKLEIEIFKTMKWDPYFKHYIENCIWENVEQRNEVVSNYLSLFSGTKFNETIPY